MPVTISGTDITINGITQVADSKVVQVQPSINGSRDGGITTNGGTGSAIILWTAHSFTRLLSNSIIRVEAVLKGYDDWSYPYYATFVQLVRPDGSSVRSFIGSTYNHHVDANGGPQADGRGVNWWVKKAFTPAVIGATTGSGFQIQYGYESASGGGNRPFVRWNFNSSDDNRAYQQHSTSYLYEYAPN
jgi:hypothetical protein